MTLGFLQGPNGEKSSKRLIAVLAGFLFLFLGLVGGITLLIQGKSEDFLNLMEIVGVFAGSGLGLGIFDNYFKSKYAKAGDNSGTS